MNISDEKVQAALDKISKMRKEAFAANVTAELIKTEQVKNSVEKVNRIFAMRDMFTTLAKKSKDNTLEVYDAALESLETSIDEHLIILASQIKEALNKI